MADGYDRFDNNEGSGGGSFVMGLLTGTVLGAGLGMLFAPKAGLGTARPALRAGRQPRQPGDRRLSPRDRERGPVGRKRSRPKDEAAGEWAERGKDVYGKAKDAVNKGADEAQRYVRDATQRRCRHAVDRGRRHDRSGLQFARLELRRDRHPEHRLRLGHVAQQRVDAVERTWLDRHPAPELGCDDERQRSHGRERGSRCGGCGGGVRDSARRRRSGASRFAGCGSGSAPACRLPAEPDTAGVGRVGPDGPSGLTR